MKTIPSLRHSGAVRILFALNEAFRACGFWLLWAYSHRGEFRIAAMFGVLIALNVQQVPAAQHTPVWEGGGTDDNWTTAPNWGAVLIGSAGKTSEANLQFAGSTRLNAFNDFSSGTAFRSITFNSGSGASTRSGNSLAIANKAGITNNSTNLQTINFAGIVLGTNDIAFNAASGSLLVNSPLSIVSGTRALMISGTFGNRVTLTGNNSYNGVTTIKSGATLNIQHAYALGATTVGTTVEDNAAIEIESGISVGAEALSIRGTGVGSNGAMRNISGNNSWSGIITLAAATRIQSDSDTLILTGGIDQKSRALTVGGDGNVMVRTTGISNNNNASALIKDGNGALTLAVNNSYGGTTTVSGGVLRLNALTALPGGIGTAGGTRNLLLNGGVIGLGSNDFERGMGTGNAQVQFIGSGGFAAYTSGRSVNLGGANGTVTWGSGSFVPTGSDLILGAADADKTLTFQNPIAFVAADRTVRVGDGSADVDAVLSGLLSSTGGGLVKTGLGTLAVTHANTYSGTTTVSSGTLLANNTSGSAFGTGAVHVDGTGILGGTGRITPSGINGINVAGMIAPGVDIGTLTFDLSGTTGGVTMQSGANFAFELGAGNVSISSIGLNTSDMIAVADAQAGDFTFNSNIIDLLGTGSLGYYKLFDASSNNANTWTNLDFDATTGLVSSGLSVSNLASGLTSKLLVGTTANGGTTGDIYLYVVPEPSSPALLGALGALALLRRYRQPVSRL